jgi:hypothetical protein
MKIDNQMRVSSQRYERCESIHRLMIMKRAYLIAAVLLSLPACDSPTKNAFNVTEAPSVFHSTQPEMTPSKRAFVPGDTIAIIIKYVPRVAGVGRTLISATGELDDSRIVLSAQGRTATFIGRAGGLRHFDTYAKFYPMQHHADTLHTVLLDRVDYDVWVMAVYDSLLAPEGDRMIYANSRQADSIWADPGDFSIRSLYPYLRFTPQ